MLNIYQAEQHSTPTYS